eukprot:PhM_4_TR8227/c0_g1_i1/m.5836/K03977/engA, der; GTPase
MFRLCRRNRVLLCPNHPGLQTTAERSRAAMRATAPTTMPVGHVGQRSWSAAYKNMLGGQPEHRPPLTNAVGDELRFTPEKVPIGDVEENVAPFSSQHEGAAPEADAEAEAPQRPLASPVKVIADTKLRVALVGTMNVGKSTLFNMLMMERLPVHNLVADAEGITRDAIEAHAKLDDLEFTVIDTPGIVEGELIEEADNVLASCDVALIMTAADVGIRLEERQLADVVRRLRIPAIHVVTKMDKVSGADPTSDEEYAEALGYLGTPLRMSLRTRSGSDDLYEALVPHYELSVMRRTLEDWDLEDKAMGGNETALDAVRERNNIDRYVRVSLVGRPNSGKSSLFNTLTGMDRSRASSVAHTTRDTIELRCVYKGQRLKIVDTPGALRVRHQRDKPFNEMIWKKMNVQMRHTNVCLIVFDAQEGVPAKGDMILAHQCISEGKAFCFAANKWDMVSDSMAIAEAIDFKLKRQIHEVKHASAVACSAHTGLNVTLLLDHVLTLYETWNKRVTTGTLTRYWRRIEKTVTLPHHVSRVRVITQTNVRPPTFLLHLQTRDDRKKLPAMYESMVRNAIVEEFGFYGVPVRIFQQVKDAFRDTA